MSAVIEINGRTYDAVTGRPLGADTSQLTRIVSQPTINDVVRPAPNLLQHHRPDTTHTLMRTVVRQPDATSKRSLKAQGKLLYIEQLRPNSPLQIKLSVHKVNPVRLERAKKAPRSEMVERFHSSILQGQNFMALTSAEPIHIPVRQVITPNPLSIEVETPKQRLESLIEHALRHANSPHEVSAVKGRRAPKRAVVVAASLAAFLVLAGTLAITNFSSVGMYVAGAKAGFGASLPSYQPDGYHLQGINYSSGVVASSFLSNSDQRQYTVTEKPSAWDNEALLQEFVQKNAATYQTVSSNGRTIYLYGNRNATWLWHGIWYVLGNNGSLGDHQLVDIASSL